MSMTRISGSTSSDSVAVAKVDEVPEGSMFGAAISGKPILVSRIGGKFYAIDAVCSHYSGYLPKGELRGDVVVCPVHKACFDLKTGRVVKNVPALLRLATGRGATDLHAYEVEVVGDSILIKF